jgi:ribosome assembly protein YihI (activator of Der GTPase)
MTDSNHAALKYCIDSLSDQVGSLMEQLSVLEDRLDMQEKLTMLHAEAIDWINNRVKVLEHTKGMMEKDSSIMEELVKENRKWVPQLTTPEKD